MVNEVTLKTLDLMRHPEADGVALVRGIDAMGREYILDGAFTYADATKVYLAITDACYVIDASRWSCRIPYGSDAWDADGMEVTLYDDQERARAGL